MNAVTVGAIDHVGLRVADKERALAFYGRLGFRVDPDEDAPAAKAIGLVNDAGARIHLIYNASATHPHGNVLMDGAAKLPGYTHAAFVVHDMDALLRTFERWGLHITEGPMVVANGRRRLCFVRDPDSNVLEFNELLRHGDPPAL
ncbi:MAG: VOC family protein [Nevskia sp.]|nr:VOC family protein [Nevskia sp.]